MTTFLGRKKRTKTKMRDVCHPLKVTLEELYNGTSRNILVHRNRVIKDSIKGTIKEK
jgi:DnaJ-class molecular chaperone